MSSQATPAGKSGGPWTRGPRAFISNAFGAGFAAAAVIAVVAGLRVFAGGDPTAAAGDLMLSALIANLILIIGLGAYLGLRVYRMVRGRGRAEPAPRLHLRFAGMFSLVAIVPSIVVAVLLGVVFARGAQSWFDERIGSAIDTSVSLAGTYLTQETELLRDDAVAMSVDLNADGVEMFSDAPIEFQKYLEFQREYRNLAAAYVVDASGTVLASSTSRVASDYSILPPNAYADADAGDFYVRTEESSDSFRALFKLEAYDGAYILVERQAAEGLFDLFRLATQSRDSYAEAAAGRGRLQLLFALLYLEIVALVLFGATWLGLGAANQIVEPIGRLVDAAGRVRDGDLDARVSLRRYGDELGALGSAFNEMTRRLKSQRADLEEATDVAEARRQFTEAVLSGVSAGVIGVNAAGEVTLANHSALELLAVEETDLVGREAIVAVPEIAGFISQARALGDDAVEGQIDVARGGKIRNLNVRAAAAKDGGGAVVVTFDDITRLVSAQRNAAWRDVARRIAHEIKNPLTPIQLSAERLKRKYSDEVTSDPETFERCTSTIIRQVSDIGRMVDEFSSFARMPEPKPEPVELGELVRSTVFAQRVANPAITFEAETPDEPVVATCDERLFGQALLNVIKNAGEAVTARMEAEPGVKDQPGRVEAHLGVDGAFAVIEIRDNGVGWPNAHRERLVEPYMTTREKGTGLGLAIVRRVVEDHHGRLELADRPDGERGAVVRLVLPLETPADKNDAETPAMAADA